MKIALDFNIDMLLDARLKLQIVSDEVMYKPIYVWCTPNLQERDRDDWHKYEPVAITTPLHFEVNILDELVESTQLYIDLNASTLELGYAGSRDAWVGPGRLFNYTLRRYLPDKGDRVAINREL